MTQMNNEFKHSSSAVPISNEYKGESFRVKDDGDIWTQVYAFWNTREIQDSHSIPDVGACFGYVVTGTVTVQTSLRFNTTYTGEYFSIDNGGRIDVQPKAKVVIFQRVGWRGVNTIGGPIEGLGRLRYIDGCSDSLIIAPPKKGDACLNHLHFPKGITQTMHTHPSVRAGVVARGKGFCITPEGARTLNVGDYFVIPAGQKHGFLTDTWTTMDVIAYHPDSDFGPTDEQHPMLNRTLVDGVKIDNSTAHTARVEDTYIEGSFTNE